ncbi:hypothetical protein VTJ49DRAFT_4356 [Mycothermus thermophilus]|uniref:Uncharacterized protein n=1 Tax=Humicola insolens TaxID=85995 RepID=A0ABR3VNH7_HUMIN
MVSRDHSSAALGAKTTLKRRNPNLNNDIRSSQTTNSVSTPPTTPKTPPFCTAAKRPTIQDGGPRSLQDGHGPGPGQAREYVSTQVPSSTIRELS